MMHRDLIASGLITPLASLFFFLSLVYKDVPISFFFIILS
jgi:hypothetical protein